MTPTQQLHPHTLEEEWEMFVAMLNKSFDPHFAPKELRTMLYRGEPFMKMLFYSGAAVMDAMVRHFTQKHGRVEGLALYAHLHVELARYAHPEVMKRVDITLDPIDPPTQGHG